MKLKIFAVAIIIFIMNNSAIVLANNANITTKIAEKKNIEELKDDSKWRIINEDHYFY